MAMTAPLPALLRLCRERKQKGGRLALTNHNYRVLVIDSLEGLAQIAGPWSDLLSKSRANTIFLTWEWIYTWAETFLGPERRLFVLAVYKDKELVGIAPWCIRNKSKWGMSLKCLEFLGTPEMGSDYLDVFAKEGKEKDVARHVSSFLFHEAAACWDSITLHDIPADSRFLLHYLYQVDEDGKHVELKPASFCPAATLPLTRSEFFANLSSNRRQQYVRHARLLAKKGKVTHQIFRRLAAAQSLKSFNTLYQERWKSSEKELSFIQKLVSRCSEKDWIQIDLLEVDGREIAALLHLRYQQTLSMLLMGVDHSFDKRISIGNILVGLSIEQAIDDGFTTYDFLKGVEDYKFHWANSGRRSLRLHCYAKKAAPLVWMTGQFMESLAKVLTR